MGMRGLAHGAINRIADAVGDVAGAGVSYARKGVGLASDAFDAGVDRTFGRMSQRFADAAQGFYDAGGADYMGYETYRKLWGGQGNKAMDQMFRNSEMNYGAQKVASRISSWSAEMGNDLINGKRDLAFAGAGMAAGGLLASSGD